MFEQVEERRLLTSINLAALTAGQGSKLFGVDAGDLSGWSVSGAGDFNGDGYDDMFVGAKQAAGVNNSKPNSGESYLIFGSPTPAATIDFANLGTGGFAIYGVDESDYSATAVSSAGDVNGDGFSDLIIGAYKADAANNAKSAAGDAYLIFGAAVSPASIHLASLGTAGVTIFGESAGDYTAISVDGAGDLNGDGFDDLIIGAPLANAYDSGKNYLLFGAKALPNTINLFTSDEIDIIGEGSGDGRSVSAAGDINGDGYDDLIIGAPEGDGSSNSKTNAGQANVVFGSADFLSYFPADFLRFFQTKNIGTGGVRIFGADAGDYSGISVSGIGDFNGDGFDDLLIGAKAAAGLNNANSDSGESYVVFGSASIPTTIDLSTIGTAGVTAGMILYGVNANDQSGAAVSAAGDVNGDGLDDLLIGAPLADAGGNLKSDAGESYLVFGTTAFRPSLNLSTIVDSASAGVTIFGAETLDNSGAAVGNAGDINGDGFADLLIGAPHADAAGNAKSNAGESYLVLGSNAFTSSVSIMGTPNGETLTGTSAPDAISGGRGNDTLVGLGGADVLNGGQGNDILAVSDISFKRIVGGLCNDTLRLDGKAFSLDLTTLPDDRLSGIEQIDITGSGKNTLIINRLELTNLSDSSNTLLVIGNKGDTLRMDGGWRQLPDETFNSVVYRVLTNGAATLKVAAPITLQTTTFDLANLNAAGATILGVGEGDQNGFAVSNAGDLNGDGFGDVVMAAHFADGLNNTKRSSGEIYVIFGAAALRSMFNVNTADLTIYGADRADYSGVSVSNAGDFNSDGFDDLLIGASGADASGNTKRDAGESYVIFGGSHLPSTINLGALGTAGITIYGAERDDRSGMSVSGAGDVNGDGLDDLLVGAAKANGMNNGETGAGECYLIFGRPAPPSTINLTNLGSNGVTIFGAETGDSSGISVSGAGDVNGDGFDDMLIGADLADGAGNHRSGAGECYLIFGGPSLPATVDLANLGSTGITIFGIDINDRSGISASGGGDINGDGFDDLLIGASNARSSGNTRLAAGETYVVFGGAALSSTISLANLGTAGITIFGSDARDYSGQSVSSAGDVNADGFDDLLIGAPSADGIGSRPGVGANQPGAGESYLIFGSATHPTTIDLANLGTAGISIFGADPGDNSGVSISGAGDINGDGFDDLLIGAEGADGGDEKRRYTGESYVIYGSNNLTASVNILGTAGNDALTGNSDANVINGGRGSDTLVGGGGADVLVGGQGNDILAVSDLTFKRIVGGIGNDTLRLNGTGLTLDLAAQPDSRILGIENIDIAGTGNNALTLNVNEVLNLSNESNTLTVSRHSGDVVNIGPGWTQGWDIVIGSNTYNVYTQGRATLRVQSFAAAMLVNPGILMANPTTGATVVSNSPETRSSVCTKSFASSTSNTVAAFKLQSTKPLSAPITKPATKPILESKLSGVDAYFATLS